MLFPCVHRSDDEEKKKIQKKEKEKKTDSLHWAVSTRHETLHALLTSGGEKALKPVDCQSS